MEATLGADAHSLNGIPIPGGATSIGVDLGARFLAVAVEPRSNRRQIVSGRALRHGLERYNRILARLARAGARRSYRKVAAKRARFLAETERAAAAAVIRFALQFPSPVLKLEGASPLKELVAQLARAQGIPVWEVTAPHSSQRCHRCGRVAREQRQGSRYRCRCGYTAQADLNAARNIAQIPIEPIGMRGYNPPQKAVGTAETPPRRWKGQRSVLRSAPAHAITILVSPFMEEIITMPNLMKDLTDATTNFLTESLDNLKSVVDRTSCEMEKTDLTGMARRVIDSTIDNTKNVIEKSTKGEDPFAMAKNLVDATLDATKNVVNTVVEENKRIDLPNTVNHLVSQGIDVAKDQANLTIDTTKKVADTLMGAMPAAPKGRTTTVTRIEVDTENKANKQ